MNPSDDFLQTLQRLRVMSPLEAPALTQSLRAQLERWAEQCLSPQLRRKADSEDLAQETLLAAVTHIQSFRGTTEAEFVSWLRSILARNVQSLVRKFRFAGARDIARERHTSQSPESSDALAEQLVAQLSSPSTRAKRSELKRSMQQALLRLPDDYREVLVLRSLEERDWDEVAQAMNRSVGAVQMLWARALKQLKPSLESHV